MSFNFNFRYLGDEKDVEQTLKFLAEKSLNYPFYTDWVYGVVREDILSGYKRAILALSDDILVGNLLLQPHKVFTGILEFKNVRVHEKLQRRFFSAFMIRQAEAEARKKYQAIICDTRFDQREIIGLLKFLGYEELLKVPLYEKNVEDIVFVKKFERAGDIFVPIKNQILKNSF